MNNKKILEELAFEKSKDRKSVVLGKSVYIGGGGII